MAYPSILEYWHMGDTAILFFKVIFFIAKGEKRFKQYGHLPPKEAEAEPWDKVCIDLIGPYKIGRQGKPDLVCKCVTMIDPATGWFIMHISMMTNTL